MEQSAKPVKEEGAISLVGAKSSSPHFSTRSAVKEPSGGYSGTVFRSPGSCLSATRTTYYVDNFIVFKAVRF